MSFFEKILFKINSVILRNTEQYRAAYFKHIYQHRVVLKGAIQLGKGSSFVFFPSGVQAKLIIGEECIFRQRCTLSLGDNGQLELGKNVFFNNDCSITCFGRVSIGNDTMLGEGVKMYDHNHEYRHPTQLIREQGLKIGEIVIGNNCWIGSNCVILNNVTIGDNVVIGANVLVHKSIPSNSIVRSNTSYSITPLVTAS